MTRFLSLFRGPGERPPQATTTWPVTYAIAGEASAAIVSAISSGSAMRPSGMLAIILSSTLAGMARVISDAVRLGAIAFTRTRGASSSASARVMPTRPPLEAE